MSPAGGATWQCGRYRLPLARPLIMGIVNVTPDSFSDGGRHADPARAVAHARQLLAEGADILDIGGESSRPGARAVAVADELARVLPVIEGLADAGVPLSIDTVKPEVMRQAIAAGASIVNDIAALQAPGALAAVAGSEAGVVLMHMRGTPQTMQDDPHYADVVGEVGAFLAGRIAAAVAAGIARERIAVDPGFGFGKLLVHNLALLRHLERLGECACPILAGLSRKSMFKGMSALPASERQAASLAGALIAVQNGAAIVRVHDVAATREALAVWAAVSSA
jgi:dihydropteroate synthase